ncbi:MAG: hypothetical protein J5545_01255 [Bacteroidaceae bacterium]|nr:hypothetical protein [Bacteroidaceae bacterium]
MKVEEFDSSKLRGRARRLFHEWQTLEEGLRGRSDIQWHVQKTSAEGLPVCYLIDYHIRSICGVTNVEHLNEPGVDNEPLYADHFRMLLELPPNYPQVDAPPRLHFLTADEQGQPIPHPWHPNIRYFGEMAGRVCINMADTYTDLLWGVRRVASYLRYETFHATLEPPYPEDLQVAAWVRRGELRV